MVQDLFHHHQDNNPNFCKPLSKKTQLATAALLVLTYVLTNLLHIQKGYELHSVLKEHNETTTSAEQKSNEIELV